MLAAMVLLTVALSLAANQRNARRNAAPQGAVPGAPVAPPTQPDFQPGDPGGGVSPPPPPVQRETPAPGAPPTGAPPVKAPAGPPFVYLNTLKARQSADGPSGQRVASVVGLQGFPNSTALFISCSSTPAKLTYPLNGGFTKFATTVGLTGDATPGNLVARVVISGDNRVLSSSTVSLDRSEAVSVGVAGVRNLVVTTQRVEGTCRSSNQPFGALGDARLLPR